MEDFLGIFALEATLAGFLDQLVRLFGGEAATPTSTLLMDWSAEIFTATIRDRVAGVHPMPYRGAWVGATWQQTL